MFTCGINVYGPYLRSRSVIAPILTRTGPCIRAVLTCTTHIDAILHAVPNSTARTDETVSTEIGPDENEHEIDDASSDESIDLDSGDFRVSINCFSSNC